MLFRSDKINEQVFGYIDSELEEQEEELADGWKDIEDGWKELQDGRKEIEDGRLDLVDAQKELDELKLVLSGYGIKQAVLYMIGDHDFERGFYKLDFGEKIIPSCMLDPRLPAPVLEEQIAACCQAGVRILKLLPYEQHIMRAEYPLVADFAQIAQGFGMTLTVCCAYGSADIYNTNGVELAAYILEIGRAHV